MISERPVVFSGIQPSGGLTLGNYLGSLQHWVKLQHDYDAIFSLVDLHAITVRQDPLTFKINCYNTLAWYLAAGLDPKVSHIFLQSHVLAHAQLAWILSCYTYIGELNRMTQFKDKTKQHITNVNAGLFTYPVLMAADILLYRSNLVPVGADQKQHLELARNLAIRFNGLYGETLVIPEAYQPAIGVRIMSLQFPQQKMSKSAQDRLATIFLLDSPDEIRLKFKRAVTDSGQEIHFAPEQQPGIANLLTILAAITNRPITDWEKELVGCGYGKFKELVAEAVIIWLTPLQARYNQVRGDQAYLDQVLAAGASYARHSAQLTLSKINDALGLISCHC